MTSLHPLGADAEGAAPRVLFWCDTTAAQPFETGIQRVTRRLGSWLERGGAEVVHVGWDPQRRLIRPLAPLPGGLSDRGAGWLLVPEIPMTVLPHDVDPVQLAHAYGLRAAAIVHDLIPIRLAHHYAPEGMRLYRRYYRMFAEADLVFATTEHVAGHLRAHLTGEGLRVPEITVVPLPAQFADAERVRTAPAARGSGEALRLLTVATWEPRKNLPLLLRAVRLAEERSGLSVALTLVGRRGHDLDLDAEIDALASAMPHVTVSARTGDAELARLYASHHASVYPSCEEGFGMPVLESLWLGHPCLCHFGSAMAEVAPGGGTLMLDMADESVIAAGLVRLAEEPGLLDWLTAEALARPLRCWADYAADVAQRLELSASKT